jgi:hypothetical protein
MWKQVHFIGFGFASEDDYKGKLQVKEKILSFEGFERMAM